ncbi:MAG: DUF4112 domain-containing protein [Mangrovibacterium sp.]
MKKSTLTYEQRRRLNESKVYALIKHLKQYLDDYYIDGIMGVAAPFVGDMLGALISMPFVYVAACKIRSLPLSLAILFNIVVDLVLGSIPILGMLIDFFYRSNTKNLHLIMGYVEQDEQMIKEVRTKAWGFGVGLLLLIAIFVLCFHLILSGIHWFIGLF